MPPRSDRRAPSRSQERPGQPVVQQTTLQASFAGPLPPPSTLQRYEELVPGAADRILAMAERNQAHRHALETAAIYHEIRASDRGQIGAVLVALAGSIHTS